MSSMFVSSRLAYRRVSQITLLTPILIKLHLLPIGQRSKYKILAANIKTWSLIIFLDIFRNYIFLSALCVLLPKPYIQWALELPKSMIGQSCELVKLRVRRAGHVTTLNSTVTKHIRWLLQRSIRQYHKSHKETTFNRKGKEQKDTFNPLLHHLTVCSNRFSFEEALAPEKG